MKLLRYVCFELRPFDDKLDIMQHLSNRSFLALMLRSHSLKNGLQIAIDLLVALRKKKGFITMTNLIIYRIYKDSYSSSSFSYHRQLPDV